MKPYDGSQEEEEELKDVFFIFLDVYRMGW